MLTAKQGSTMPTVLMIRGWRVFFYSEEGREPMHIHARKGDAECKMWLVAEDYNVVEAWSYNLTPRLRREIRKSVFEHFDLIVEEWKRHIESQRDASDNTPDR